MSKKFVSSKNKINPCDIKLPQQFLLQFENDFGSENKQKYIDCFECNAVRGVRFNINKNNGNYGDFYNFLSSKLKKINYFDNCYYLSTDEKLGNSIIHQAGVIYLQEPSSMCPVASVSDFDFNNKLVLDLCASPGGKSTQIASLLNNTGLLVSSEIDKLRAKTLFSNIERLGIKNAVVLNQTPQNLAKHFNQQFDYIFVDAPCSGEGMFRKDKNAILEWNENLKHFNRARQLEILSCANSMLKPNGILVYSTCTFNTIENETVVDEFMQNYNYQILPLPKKITDITLAGKLINNNECLINTAHFMPFVCDGEGQFVAVLKKSQTTDDIALKPADYKCNLTQLELKIVKQFFENHLIKNCYEKFDFIKINNNICLLEKKNHILSFNNLNVLSYGVILGQIVKDRLNVHHQFFSAYGDLFKNFVNLRFDGEIIKNYVLGNELDIEFIKNSDELIEQSNEYSNYGVIKANGYNLGGYKLTNGKLKNHYPKAFRLNKIN